MQTFFETCETCPNGKQDGLKSQESYVYKYSVTYSSQAVNSTTPPELQVSVRGAEAVACFCSPSSLVAQVISKNNSKRSGTTCVPSRSALMLFAAHNFPECLSQQLRSHGHGQGITCPRALCAVDSI